MGNVLLFLLFFLGGGSGNNSNPLWDDMDLFVGHLRLYVSGSVSHTEGGVADDTVTHLPPLISGIRVDGSCRRGRIGAWLGPEIGKCQPEAPRCLL